MALSVERFLDSLNSSGLMAPGQTAGLRQQHASADGAIADGETIAQQLVAEGLLTEYQANAVCADHVKHLKLGEYTVIDKIGEGGMGQVFKAIHNRMDRLAAIKIISDTALQDQHAVDRFNQEVRVAAKIAHPNIVLTYDASEQNGVHYLVMEYIDGEDLGTLLADHGPLSVDQAIDVILQTAKGLEYAHRRQVVHRDIKPGNLLLDEHGVVKILDMGLARMSGDSKPLAITAAERLTNAGQVMGTLDYMAPEQAENARNADARSDIYSLGCTIFPLLTGHVPFPAQSLVESIMAHREAPIPSVQDECADAPDWLNELARRCMSKHPSERHQTATEVIELIEQNLRTDNSDDTVYPGIRSAITKLGGMFNSTVRGFPTLVSGKRDSMRSSPASEDDNRVGPVYGQPVDANRQPMAPVQGPAAYSPQPVQPQQHFIPPQPTTLPGHAGVWPRKHRGLRILILGALGLLISPGVVGLVCGIIAAAAGRSDLTAMQAGRTDIQGKRKTTIGVILGLLAIANTAYDFATGFFGS